jgi:hypothetical protein
MTAKFTVTSLLLRMFQLTVIKTVSIKKISKTNTEHISKLRNFLILNVAYSVFVWAAGLSLLTMMSLMTVTSCLEITYRLTMSESLTIT